VEWGLLLSVEVAAGYVKVMPMRERHPQLFFQYITDLSDKLFEAKDMKVWYSFSIKTK
jgi:hypothetical protein